MDTIWIIAWVLAVLGVIGTLMPLLPGVPLLYAGLLLAAWHDGFAKVSVLTISMIGVLAGVAWAVDFFGSYITAKKVGASKQALWGVVIGALFGLAGGIVGLVIGPVIGAVIGEYLAHQNSSRATTVGLAAGLGFIVAFILKILLVLLMLGIFAYAYYD